jgi:hypothetical protein
MIHIDMRDYVHLFNTQEQFDTARDITNYYEPWLSLVTEEGRVDYNIRKDFFKPLTLEARSDGEIKWTLSNAAGTAKSIEYSKDGETWTTITSTTEGASIPVAKGDVVRLRGDNAAYGGPETIESSSTLVYSQFKFSEGLEAVVYGNVMSLISSTGYTGVTELTGGFNLYGLFKGDTGLTTSSGRHTLFLPATTLAQYCYCGMFANTGVRRVPELPAMTLAPYCYIQMFANCKKLVNPGKLPATTLAAHCYRFMFQ